MSLGHPKKTCPTALGDNEARAPFFSKSSWRTSSWQIRSQVVLGCACVDYWMVGVGRCGSRKRLSRSWHHLRILMVWDQMPP
jgi:hypothetical protein